MILKGNSVGHSTCLHYDFDKRVIMAKWPC